MGIRSQISRIAYCIGNRGETANTEKNAMLRIPLLRSVGALAVLVVYTQVAIAQTIIDEWSTVKAPPPPRLITVAVDPRSTALLMLDFLKQNCPSNPRCVATVSRAQTLLDAARSKGLVVVYTDYPGGGEVLPEVARKSTEPLITSFVDKFVRTTRDGTQDTGLDKILKDHGIKSVIIVGSSANGSILYTASGAAFRGYQTIVAVDSVSARDPYIEQAVIYHFISVPPPLAGKVTLTRTDMIKF